AAVLTRLLTRSSRRGAAESAGLADLDDRGGATGRRLVGVLMLVRCGLRIEQYDDPVVVALVEEPRGDQSADARTDAALRGYADPHQSPPSAPGRISSQVTGRVSGPSTAVPTLKRMSSKGTARRSEGMRRATVARTVVSSSRASCWPTHWCGPWPNPRCA